MKLKESKICKIREEYIEIDLLICSDCKAKHCYAKDDYRVNLLEIYRHTSCVSIAFREINKRLFYGIKEKNNGRKTTKNIN
ncbi:MAG: hypothetical protein Q4E88_02845 [Coriobacteriia bacterium]|nr:hypothetical protein [Coriobacteriia bacterium]